MKKFILYVSFEHILFRNDYGCSNKAHVVVSLKFSSVWHLYL